MEEGGVLRVKKYEPLDQEVENTASAIIDAAFKVHRTLGPGLLESVYETCMVYELTRKKQVVRTQVTVPIMYEGLRIDNGLRLDLLVNAHVIVELKAVENMLPVFETQLLSYLKLTGLRLGLLFQFQCSSAEGWDEENNSLAGFWSRISIHVNDLGRCVVVPLWFNRVR